MRFLILLIILLALIPAAGAADISLAWDPSISPNIAGYKVYIGKASRTYWTPVTIGNQTTYTVPGLGPGTYYFAVTAFNVDKDESDFSNEVSQVIADPAFSVTSTSASLRWFGVVLQCTTTLKSSAILRYSKIETGAGTTAVIVTTGATKTKHQAVLYLPAGAAYYRYEWEVTSAAGNIVKSGSTFQMK
jgi:hypothetical protein